MPAGNYTRDDVTGSVRLQVPLTGGPMVLDFNEGATEVFADRSDVSAAQSLSVAEIIARHQEQQRAQDLAVRNYSADARMEQHFRPTMADSGYDVVTENRYYVERHRDRVGGAVVFGQRREVGSRPSAVSAAAGGEGAVASACSFDSTRTTATSCAGPRW